jgi:hypothetical protein
LGAIAALAVLAGLGAAGLAQAQSSDPGITGHVADEAGEPLRNVVVSKKSEQIREEYLRLQAKALAKKLKKRASLAKAGWKDGICDDESKGYSDHRMIAVTLGFKK